MEVSGFKEKTSAIEVCLPFTDLDYPSIREWLATHAEPATPLDVDIYSSTYTKSDFVPYDKRTYQSQGYQQDESIKVGLTSLYIGLDQV